MKRVRIWAAFSGLAVAFSIAPLGWSGSLPGQAQASARQSSQASSSSQGSADFNRPSADLRSGSKIDAQLESAVDAKTAKPGDQVVARVTKNVKQHGTVVVHKRDRLIGHVTSVQSGASAKAGSTLGVAFSELQGRQGTSSLNTVLTSVFSTHNNASAQEEEMPMGGPMMGPMAGGGVQGSASGSGSARGGGDLLGGVGSTVGSTVNAAGSAVGGLGGAVGSTVGGAVDAAGSTVGQVGAAGNGAGNVGGLLATPLRAIHLQNEAHAQGNGNAQASSLLSTKHGDLRLAPGTGMRFRVLDGGSRNTNANAGASKGNAHAKAGVHAHADAGAQANND